MNENQAMAVLHRVRDDILVGPAPVEQVIATAAGRQRHRRAALAAAAAVAVVAGAGAVVALQDDDSERPEPAVRLVENPAPVAWWGDGVLHVAHAEVEMAQPEYIVPVADGVVALTEPTPGETRTRLVHVTDDGAETMIGTRSFGYRLASDPGTGWVAWVDHPENEPTVLVVYDTEAGAEVARLDLPDDGPRHEVLDEGPYPLAIEDGVVHYASWDADYRWDVAGDEEPEPVTASGTYLLSRESGVELTRTHDPERGYGPPVVGSASEQGTELPDHVAVLSPDGRYALGLTLIGSYVRVFDVASGDRIPSGLTDDRAVVGATFGPGGTLVSTIGTPWEPPDDGWFSGPRPGSYGVAPFDIVSCEIGTTSCTTVVDGIEGEAIVLQS